MTRHFWNIFTNKKSTEALHDIEVVVRDFGYIVDYKKFAEDYRILQIEVESPKVETFFKILSELKDCKPEITVISPVVDSGKQE